MIMGEGGDILKDVKYFDHYVNDKGKKSLACHLIFWDKEKTLTNDDIGSFPDQQLICIEFYP